MKKTQDFQDLIRRAGRANFWGGLGVSGVIFAGTGYFMDYWSLVGAFAYAGIYAVIAAVALWRSVIAEEDIRIVYRTVIEMLMKKEREQEL